VGVGVGELVLDKGFALGGMMEVEGELLVWRYLGTSAASLSCSGVCLVPFLVICFWGVEF
jgi:hypothetical protein